MNKIILNYNCFFGSNFLFFASWPDNHIVEYEIEDTRTGEITKSSLDKEESDLFIKLIDEIDFYELYEEYCTDDKDDAGIYELVVVQKAGIFKCTWEDDMKPETLKNIYRAVNLCEPLIDLEEED